MRFFYLKFYRFLLFAYLNLILLIPFTIITCPSAKAGWVDTVLDPEKVLFISAYHPGFPTFLRQVGGLKDTFEKKNILLDIEFMDTKRFPDGAGRKRMETFLFEKLKTLPAYDVIVVGDDNAFDFALRRQKDLFKEVPIVFLGVNNVERAVEQNNNPLMTGVVEAVSMADTIRLMEKFQPESKRIMAIVDPTPSGQGDLDTFYKLSGQFPGLEFSHLSLADMTWQEFGSTLENLTDDSSVLLLSAYKDIKGQGKLFNESLSLIKTHFSGPVYHLWYHGIGQGLIGGKVISHHEQASTAGKIVLDILNGKPVKEMKVVSQSPNRYVFDYNVLKTHKISLSLLPKESIVLNRPFSFFTAYKHIILGIGFTFAILITALLFALFNIISRKKTEEALRSSQERYDLAMRFANDGLFDWEISTNHVYFSTGWKKILGYDDYEIQNTLEEWERLTAPEDVTKAMAMTKELIQGKRERFETEIQMRHKKGHMVDILVRANIIQDEKGKAIRMVGTHVDITHRKQAEKELRISQERFITVLNSIDATIYVADMDTHEILFMNQYMIKAFGGDFTGKLCWEVFRGERGPCPSCTNAGLIDENGEPTGLVSWQGKNPVTGQWFVNHDRAIRWSDGRLVKLQVATDISELKKMENQLLQARKMESVGRLAGGVAHDFNNMLAVILGNIEIILDDLTPENPVISNVHEIQKAATRSVDLTRQLLAFARKQTISPKVLNLNHTIEGMLKMLRRLIGEDIDLAWYPSKELWPVKMDPSQVDQILANLCVNARDAIDNIGEIVIETNNTILDDDFCKAHEGCTPGEYIGIFVRDNGHGIDLDTREKLFEPFFTTKEMEKGTGLGLATVYGIIKQNKGFIDVESEPGKGSLFKIYIPRCGLQAPEITAENLSDASMGGSETILIVEDEPAILSMATMMLKRFGYNVLTASSPAEALDMENVNRAGIDLLISDVVMPGMNGKDLSERLKEYYPNLKCLFMSGYTSNVIAHHGILADGMQFLQKPFSKTDLGKKIRHILDND